jgi:hypothetical protein
VRSGLGSSAAGWVGFWVASGMFGRIDRGD